MRRRFYTLDVFTDKRFTGNPLAVVLDPDGLDGVAMQTIAREFNHPETVFVLPPDDAKHRAKLRIFTPAAELPFAGHPTVGTAVLLAKLDGANDAREFVVEEKIGPVTCHVTLPGDDRGYARFMLPSLPKPAGDLPETAGIAGALSLSTEEIGFEGAKPERWSAGVAFSFVPVRSLDALARARPHPAQFETVFGIDGPGRVFLYCLQAGDPANHVRARMFAPGMGIPEDPATGAAAAGFAGLMTEGGGCGDGDHMLRVEQGVEMGRPSVIEIGLAIRGGKLSSATIGGNAVLVTEGTIEA